MVFDNIAGDIGLTPKYDIIDLPVTLDLNECDEFFLTRPPPSGVFYVNCNCPWVLIEYLF